MDPFWVFDSLYANEQGVRPMQAIMEVRVNNFPSTSHVV